MSTLKVNTLEEATSGGATFFTAKAWVNFNGQGTPSIRADGNVSSLTDNGTATYTINFTNSLSSSNYAVSGSVSDNALHGRMLVTDENPSTGSRKVMTKNDANGAAEEKYVCADFVE